MPYKSLIIVYACLFALGGCYAQVSPDYQGEDLLTITGSVEIVSERDRGPLVPALAFAGYYDSLLHIVEVEVEGEFPSDFTLRVYEPPPKEAFLDEPDFPAMALAFITAVTRDHPDTVPYALPGESSSSCIGDATTGLNIDCEITERWCGGSPDRGCYEETRKCPNSDSPPEQCEIISASGDPTLREAKDYWKAFAGLSEQYVVIYLAEPSTEDNQVARTWNLAGLETGYHLMWAPGVTEAGRRAVEKAEEACRSEAEALALQRYNEAEQTDFTPEQFWSDCVPGEECAQSPPPEVYNEVENLVAQAFEELECRQNGEPQEVKNPEKERISIRISPDVQPYW